VFIHSVAAYMTIPDAKPDMVAGHSLGEFSALVANGVLRFEDALKLVSIRAKAMQKACELQPSTMAAVLALEDGKVESICDEIQRETGEIVVPANYNCPGQLVISGSLKGVETACERMKAAGAKRALMLPVGGAFHSPLMQPAKEELSFAIGATEFHQPLSPIYQNVAARAVIDPQEIKENLINQLTGAVKWTQTVVSMVADGATNFTEAGPGKVLQGLVSKINRDAIVGGVS
jgi:[acyl-carrier-protein] S-malonyltransferase